MEVEITSSLSSYGADTTNTIYDSSGTQELLGEDFGNLETGEVSELKYYYIRHNGTEPIYNVGFFLRALGAEWGGYVSSSPDSKEPYNPNMFREGGVDEDGIPYSSTKDYEFMRKIASGNPDMGVRLHQDREDSTKKDYSLGYDSRGLSFSPVPLKFTALDFSKSSNDKVDGFIYPEPVDSSKKALDGDEAKIGVTVRIPEDTIGAGYIQFSTAMSYRYTS